MTMNEKWDDMTGKEQLEHGKEFGKCGYSENIQTFPTLSVIYATIRTAVVNLVIWVNCYVIKTFWYGYPSDWDVDAIYSSFWDYTFTLFLGM